MSRRQNSVMVIHGNPVLLEALACFFRSFDILVATTATVRDGKRFLETVLADHVILDTSLPGAMDLLGSIAANHPEMDVVAVVDSDDGAQMVRSMGFEKLVLADSPLDHVADSIIDMLEERVPAQKPNMEAVLVVDDESETLDVTTRFLVQQGYSALMARTAGEAIRIVENNPRIGVVVLDVVMPGMGGMEALRVLTELPGPRGVIIMSSLADRVLVRTAQRLGAFDYIPKLDLKRLHSSIVACLAHSDYQKKAWWRRLVQS
jgi:DNA-binding NtrC family response regulator